MPFPSGQSSSLDVSKFRPAFTTATDSTGVYVTALNVSGVGVVTGINMRTVSGAPLLRITIDGVQVVNGGSIVFGINQAGSINTNWFFYQSLLIEYQSNGGNAATISIAYSVS